MRAGMADQQDGSAAGLHPSQLLVVEYDRRDPPRRVTPIAIAIADAGSGTEALPPGPP